MSIQETSQSNGKERGLMKSDGIHIALELSVPAGSPAE